jgi:hypothetical protein
LFRWNGVWIYRSCFKFFDKIVNVFGDNSE